MGAPKQKWTSDEEAALKAGVIKHGAGKWRTILKDPEFSGVLYLRSNVDLKDKWRNMSVMTNGWGSREKSRVSLKRTPPVPKQDENTMSLSTVVESDEEMMDAKPLSVSNATQEAVPPKRSIVKLDNLIMESITSLREPSGSNKTTIAAYIEEQYWAPPNFKRILSAKLKYMTGCGKLIKVKRRYRIAPTRGFSERRNSSMLVMDGRQRISPKADKDEIFPTKAEIDLELAKMRTMTAQEAAIAAARAVAEAEAAMAEAEKAAREAEVAEADAEVAQAFAEVAMKSLKGKTAPKTMIRA